MSDKEKYLKLVELCDEHFINTMIQPYAGANRECLFCGNMEGRHPSDCPVSKYKGIMDV